MRKPTLYEKVFSSVKHFPFQSSIYSYNIMNLLIAKKTP